MPRAAAFLGLVALVLALPADARELRIERVALTGDPAPGTGGDSFGSVGTAFTGPVVNDAGVIGFEGSGPGAPGSFRGFFVGTPVLVDLVALEGTPAPDAGGDYTCLCPEGGVSFGGGNALVLDATIGTLPPTTPGLRITPALAERIVDLGFPLPPPADGVSSALSVSQRSGALVYHVVTQGTGQTGLFVERGGSVTTVALEGEPAPNTGQSFFFPNSVRLGGPDAFGRAAFRGQYGFASRGIFAGNAVQLNPVALAGQSADDTPGLDFTSSYSHPNLNPDGKLVFRAGLSDGSGALFQDVGGLLEPIVLAGDPAPGTGGRDFGDVLEAQLADTGTVLFLAELESNGSPAGSGLFFEDDRSFEPLVLSGAEAPGTGGASFTGFWLSQTPQTSIAASGQFVTFGATLSDGRSGIFRGSAVLVVPALPAPAAWLLALALPLAALGLRWVGSAKE